MGAVAPNLPPGANPGYAAGAYHERSLWWPRRFQSHHLVAIPNIVAALLFWRTIIRLACELWRRTPAVAAQPPPLC